MRIIQPAKPGLLASNEKVVSELHFILPSIEAGESVKLTATTDSKAATDLQSSKRRLTEIALADFFQNLEALRILYLKCFSSVDRFIAPALIPIFQLHGLL